MRYLWVVFLSGCAGCNPETELPVVLAAAGTEPVGLWGGQAEGVGTAMVPFLVVNELGASVAGKDIGLTSSATLGANQITPDATGWAFATVAGDAPGAFDITAEQSTGSATGTGFLLDKATVRLGFPVWPSTDADGPIAGAGNGVVSAQGGELWWFPPAGGAGIRVLALEQPVVELLAVQLDEDGVSDLIVWSDGAVVLLRGRAEGGVSFYAGWTAKNGNVAGAHVADLDEDSIADVLVAVNDGAGAKAVWLSGSGQGTWSPTAVFEADFNVHGITGEDYDSNGIAEITLLSDDGILRRYANLDGEWQAASQNDFNLSTGAGARVFGGHDLTNDGWLDIVVSGPELNGDGYFASCASPGGTSQAVIYDLASDGSPVGSFVADGDGDGMSDVFISEAESFLRARWSTDSATFAVMGFQGLPAAETFAIDDIDGDGLGDILFPGIPARSVLANSAADNPETSADETEAWKIRASYSGIFDLGLLGQPAVTDFDQNGVIDLVALTSNSGLSLQVFLGEAEFEGTAENIRSIALANISATGVGLDLAVCENEAWALISDSGELLLHYEIGADGSLTALGSVAVPDSTMVTCGNLGEFAAATVGSSGNITYVRDDGSTVSETGSGQVGDFAAGDLDGDGIAELHTVPVGSSLVIGDIDGNGTDDLVSSDGLTTSVAINGSAESFTFGGSVTLGDADGDSVLDVLVHQDGVVAVARGLGGRLGIPSALWLPKDTRGGALVGDLDGNGLPDVFVLGDERDATDTNDWAGTVLYVEAPDIVSE